MVLQEVGRKDGTPLFYSYYSWLVVSSLQKPVANDFSVRLNQAQFWNVSVAVTFCKSKMLFVCEPQLRLMVLHFVLKEEIIITSDFF
jgi:hypothetical protein